MSTPYALLVQLEGWNSPSVWLSSQTDVRQPQLVVRVWSPDYESDALQTTATLTHPSHPTPLCVILDEATGTNKSQLRCSVFNKTQIASILNRFLQLITQNIWACWLLLKPWLKVKRLQAAEYCVWIMEQIECRLVLVNKWKWFCYLCVLRPWRRKIPKDAK